MMSTRCGTRALLFICVFNLLDNAKLPEIMIVALSVCGACNEVVRSRQQGLVCGTSTRPFHRTCASMNQVENRVHKREGTLHAWRRENCKSVAARLVEPQIHDPVLNQMEKPDRITSQDGIVWGFVKSPFEILKQPVLQSYCVYAYLLFHQLSKAFITVSIRKRNSSAAVNLQIQPARQCSYQRHWLSRCVRFFFFFFFFFF